jgi:ribose transport system substrate-binding protein
MAYRTLFAAAATIAALFIAGCGSSDSGNAKSGDSTSSAASGGSSSFTKKSPLKVGYSVFDLKQPYWQLYVRGIKDQAKKDGYAYVESDQKSSEQTQVAGSADLISQGISALIVSPIQPSALPATITQAHAAKIPVVIGDVGAVGPYDTYVLSNNTNGGKLAAQYMVKQLEGKPGTKKIAVVELDPGITVGKQRVQGFVDELKTHPDFKIVSSLNGHNDTQGGFSVTQNALSSNPDLAGVFTANDPMGEGASQALAQAKKAKDVVLVSFNGDPPALDLVEQGKMAATVVQDPYGQGVTAMKAVVSLLGGDKPPFTLPAQKTIEFPVKLATKENVAELKARNATLLGG